MSDECSEYVHPHLKVHSSSTRSHPSKEENHSKDCKCKRAFYKASLLRHVFYSHVSRPVLQSFVQDCISRACLNVTLAISNTPSFVSFPPMKPVAWTNTQPGIPLNLVSSSSRTPRHSSSRLNLILINQY
jgi:hypothetical protein